MLTPILFVSQYIGIQVDVPEFGHMQARQYSLSDFNTAYYRVSIKRDHSNIPGAVSNIMHTKQVGDVVRCSHALGDFVLRKDLSATTPVVLLSAGIGLTPVLAMLNSLMTHNSSRPISWIHAAHTSSARAFQNHVRKLGKTHENMQTALFNSLVTEEDVKGETYDYQGHIQLEQLNAEKQLFTNQEDTRYYVCGPLSFMVKMKRQLVELGVPESRVSMEYFGTGGEI